jgi:hypothetical protein
VTPRPAFLLAALLALGCSRPPPPPLAVEYAGCIQVLRTGPTCLLQAGKDGASPKITIWLPLAPSDTTTEIRIDDLPVAVAGEEALDGLRYPIDVPLTARRLEVRRHGPSGPSSWSLALAQSPIAPDWFTQARADASSAVKSGSHEAIEKIRKILITRLAGLPPNDHSLRARVLWLLSRLPPVSEQGYRREIEARRKADHLLGEAAAASALADDLAEHGRLSEASTVLDRVAPPPGSPAEALTNLDYGRGLIARLAGETRQALRNFKAVADRSDRLGLGNLRAAAEQQRALALLDLGRFAEADALFTASEGSSVECAEEELTTNRGWTRLLAREARFDVGDPLPDLLRARDVYEITAGCDASHQRLNARINLALAHLQAGRLDAATANLDEARPLARNATADERHWQGEIEARLALARGRAREARQLWQGLEAKARRAGALENLWLALTGRARAERALSDSPSALRAVDEAEDLLDRRAATAERPSRARLVAQREASARLRVELLLDSGRTTEALAAARRSRARVLRQIEMEGRIEQLDEPERARWQRAIDDFRAARRQCDEEAAADWATAADRLPLERSARAARCMRAEEDLETAVAELGLSVRGGGEEGFRPPGKDELLLAFHPLDRGWVAFAAEADGIIARRFDLPSSIPADRNDLSARLLTPIAEAIRRARRIRLLPYGALREVDLHVLPFEKAPLLAARPVVYGLDLLDRPTAVASTNSRSSALVIGDPRGDLPLSRNEAERVENALSDGGWRVEKESGDDATVDRLLAALPRISLLHFAGHGVAGSADGGGELLLSNEERLLATEILNLDRAPARIVLSGCATGLSDPGAAVEGLGLAQAFLLRGASQVVAAIRPVPDQDAAALFAAFYQPPPKGSADLDLAVRLARVQAAALRNGRKEAASFRVFEP